MGLPGEPEAGATEAVPSVPALQAARSVADASRTVSLRMGRSLHVCV